MSRHAKGPRLYLRPASGERPAGWIIRDGPKQRGTGLSIGASEAEKADALRAYLTEQHTAQSVVGTRDPSQIPINDVLALYVRDVINNHARPEETAARIGSLRRYWGGRKLSQVTGPTCRAYAAQRTTRAAARRELEDLRAAINHHRREGLCDKIVSVILPPKGDPRERWLTRQEAAQLILGAWRFQEVQKGQETDKRPRRHVARFMVVARYMGSRAAVICGASIERTRPAGKPWVDLVNGIFYGRPVGQRETKKRRQTVRIPRPLLAHMRRWKANGQRYVVEWREGPVKRITKAHNAAVASAGFGPEVTPHTWRHTAATWYMQSGLDLWEAAGFLGMTVEILERVYGHHRSDSSTAVDHALGTHRARHSIVTDKSEQKSIARHLKVAESR